MDQEQATDRHTLMLQEIAVTRNIRRQRSGALMVKTAHPVSSAATGEASRQQVADSFEIAFLDLAKTRLDGEHGVYQRA
jgi:hypothetical protein